MTCHPTLLVEAVMSLPGFEESGHRFPTFQWSAKEFVVRAYNWLGMGGKTRESLGAGNQHLLKAFHSYFTKTL